MRYTPDKIFLKEIFFCHLSYGRPTPFHPFLLSYYIMAYPCLHNPYGFTPQVSSPSEMTLFVASWYVSIVINNKPLPTGLLFSGAPPRTPPGGTPGPPFHRSPPPKFVLSPPPPLPHQSLWTLPPTNLSHPNSSHLFYSFFILKKLFFFLEIFFFFFLKIFFFSPFSFSFLLLYYLIY